MTLCAAQAPAHPADPYSRPARELQPL